MTGATKLPGLEERRRDGLRWFAGGEGGPVVLVHGLSGSALNWCEVTGELARGARVVAPDLPGHGASAPPRRGATVADFADAVAAVVEAEGAAPALVAGHSLGGLVALRLAHRRPELVRSLLLVAPAGIATSTRTSQVLVAAATRLRPGRYVSRARTRYAGRAWYRRALFRPFFVADAVALSERATLGLLDAHSEHTDVWTAGRAMVRDDPRLELEGIRCPALVLWGARDPQLPVADAFEYARRLRAPVRLVADCGHLVLVERPEAVLDGIRHLQELPLEAEAARQ